MTFLEKNSFPNIILTLVSKILVTDGKVVQPLKTEGSNPPKAVVGRAKVPLTADRPDVHPPKLPLTADRPEGHPPKLLLTADRPDGHPPKLPPKTDGPKHLLRTDRPPPELPLETDGHKNLL